MRIKKINISNYRNYENSTITFSDGLNVIIGANAQGKSNLIEAIYFCAIGKSLRTNKEKEVILWNNTNAKIQLELEKRFGKRNISIIFSKSEKKTIKINSIPIHRMGELMGEFNAIYFSPEELKLVKESPEDRRRFMDIDISQTSKNYFYNLSRYEKILANRNKLLKTNYQSYALKETLSIWNEQLSNVGSKIIYERIQFLNKLSHYAKLAHDYLTKSAESLQLSYSGITGNTVEEIKSEMLAKLNKNCEKDIELGYTSIGPHRDDIKILVNDIDIKSFGSQGQQRTCALSLKLAELEIIKEQIGEYPILLLDDVLSELDTNRQQRLINFTKKTQTILTCNSYNYACDNLIKISNGKQVN